MTDFNYIECYDCYNRDISPSGYDLSRSASHSVNRNVSLSIGEIAIPLNTRTRTYSTSVALKYRGKGVSWEIWNPNKHVNNFTEGWWAESYLGSLSDVIHDVTSEIIFMDLRTDLVVFKEVTTDILVNSSGFGIPEILPQNTPGLVDRELYEYVKFPNTVISRTTTTKYKILVNGETREISSSVVTSQENVNLVLNFTKYFRIQTKFVDLGGYYDWQPYFIDSVPNPDADGYDWFEPFWMDPYVKDTIDEAANELFRQYYGNTGTLSEPNVLTDDGSYKSPGPQGSWAVDAKGNLFASQTMGSEFYNRLINADNTEDDPVQITGIVGDNPVFYPIAPV